MEEDESLDEDDAEFEDLTEEEEEQLHKDTKMFVDITFPTLWSGNKQDFKELSKRELAEQMYYVGMFHAMHYHHSQMKSAMKKAEELEKNPSLLQKFLEKIKDVKKEN